MRERESTADSEGQGKPMNDPHVKALYYWVEHDESVDYDNAVPLDHEYELATVHLENRELVVRPKEHYASVQEAREALDGFIRGWEFDVAVEVGTREFGLKYMHADIIDRDPEPPQSGVLAVAASPVRFRVQVSEPRVKIGKSKYPGPPENPTLDSDNPTALAMLSRLDRYHQGRETLGAMSYFCLTVMQDSAKIAQGATDAKKAARDYYGISVQTQSRVAGLSTNKGGKEEGRKGASLQEAFNDDERKFLLDAVKKFTRRVAERAGNPSVRSAEPSQQ